MTESLFKGMDEKDILKLMKNLDAKILTLKTLEERTLFYEKPIHKYRLKEKPIKKDEPHQKKQFHWELGVDQFKKLLIFVYILLFLEKNRKGI